MSYIVHVVETCAMHFRGLAGN